MNRTRSLVAACAVLLAVLVTALPAVAQTDITTGRLVGRAFDGTGQPLPGVMVQAKNRATGLNLTAVTDERGLYRIIAVPPGSYDVTASLSGFQAGKRTGIVINVGAAVTLDFNLQLSTVAREVTVTAAAPLIETTQTESGTTVTSEAIQALPLSSRNFADFVLATPNAQRETQRGNLALGGQRGINTMITVDGVDFTNSFYGGISAGAEGRSPISITQEAIREFQVVQAGASAEFGRSSGGFVNVVTKSGSNDFHGSVFGYYRPSDWSAKLADGTDPKDSKKNNLGLSIGGPILKDSLFFFGTYERQRQNTTIPISSIVPADEAILVAKFPTYPVSGSTYIQGVNADSYFGRLDYQVADAHRLTGRLSYTKYEGPNGTYNSTTMAEAHNGIEGMKGLSGVLQWNGMFGKNVINDLNFQYGTEDVPRENVASGANLPELQIFSGGPTLGGVYFLPITATQKRATLFDSVTYMFGQHVFKVGAEYNYNTMDQVFKGSWRGVYLFQATGSGATAQTALQNFQAGKWNEYREFVGLNGKTADQGGQYNEPQKEYAGFIQDQWYVNPKLTVTLGLRYEFQKNPDDPVLDANKVVNPALGIVQPDAKIPSASNQFSPRLSLAYSPDPNTVVRFSAGRYFARFPAILTSQLYTSNAVAGTTFTITGLGATGPAPGQVAPGWGAAFDPMKLQPLGSLPAGAKLPPLGIYVIDQSFKNPHTDQAILALERDFFGLSWGVEGQYSKGYDLERMTDINLTASTNPAVDCPLLDPNSGVTCYGLKGKTNRPNPNYGIIREYTSDGRSEFWAVTLKVRKNFANGLRFFAAVTRGSDKDTDSNERNYGGFTLEDVNNSNLNWGYADRDIKWRMVANSSYDFKITKFLDGFAGVLFAYQTGRPFTPYAGQDLNVDGTSSSTDRPTVNGVHLDRNSYRFPDFYTLDLRIGVAFPIGPGRLSVFGECFNCTNTANRGMTNTTYGLGPAPSTTFAIANTVTTSPRQLQGAIRYDF